MRHLGFSSTGLSIALLVGSLSASAGSAFAAEAAVQTNASGEVVSHASTETLQRALAKRHFYQGKIDGNWGPRTEAALRDFQAKNELQATGRIDEATARKLDVNIERMDLDGRAPAGTAAVVGRDADDANTSVQLTSLSNAQAKEMQQRLQLLGYYKGPIDGDVGQGTRSALSKFFQHQASLASNGSVSNAAISLFGTQPNEIQRVSGTDKR